MGLRRDRPAAHRLIPPSAGPLSRSISPHLGVFRSVPFKNQKPTENAPEGGDIAYEQKQVSHQVPKHRKVISLSPSRAIVMPDASRPTPSKQPCVALLAGPRDIPRPASQAHFPSSSSRPGSPRNNEAWAAPAASFAYRRGLANGLRRGFGTQCCHQRVRVCASVTAAVAVAVTVGGWPGGAQPRGDRPRRPLPQRVAAAWPGRAQRPSSPGRAPSRCRWRG